MSGKGRHRRLRSHYGRKAAATVVFAFGAAVVSTAWTGAAADAPVKYGWWSATNAGTPFTPPAPPDVPAKGLYVENNVSGPSAISAITFNIPSGATVGALTLVATGNPIMSSPPMACAIPTAGQNYRPAEDGAWSDKPAYDCKTGQAKGTVGPDGKTVTFAIASLVRSGALSVAIIATGQADRIPFNAPSSSSLLVTSAGSSSSSGSAAPAMGTGAPASGTPASGATAPKGAAPGAPAAPAPPGSGSVTAGAAPDAGVPPAVASPQQAQSNPTGSTANAAPAAASSPSHARVNAATVLGLAAMVAALLFWTEGFGVLGGRVHSLAGRRRPPSAAASYPDEPAISEPATAAGQS